MSIVDGAARRPPVQRRSAARASPARADSLSIRPRSFPSALTTVMMVFDIRGRSAETRVETCAATARAPAPAVMTVVDTELTVIPTICEIASRTRSWVSCTMEDAIERPVETASTHCLEAESCCESPRTWAVSASTVSPERPSRSARRFSAVTPSSFIRPATLLQVAANACISPAFPARSSSHPFSGSMWSRSHLRPFATRVPMGSMMAAAVSIAAVNAATPPSTQLPLLMASTRACPSVMR